MAARVPHTDRRFVSRSLVSRRLRLGGRCAALALALAVGALALAPGALAQPIAGYAGRTVVPGYAIDPQLLAAARDFWTNGNAQPSTDQAKAPDKLKEFKTKQKQAIEAAVKSITDMQADPIDVAAAFRQVAASQRASLDRTLDSMAGNPDFKPSVAQLRELITKGQTLRSAAENFWYTAKIGRYDAALGFANDVLKYKDQPNSVLKAFEQVTGDRNEDMDIYLGRFRAVPNADLAKAVAQIDDMLRAGRDTRRASGQFIKAQIERLIVSPTGFSNGQANLKISGEFAVPYLINDLASTARGPYHDSIRQVIRSMGADALNPLIASTEMSDTQTLAQVALLLGDLGYPEAAPYLLKLHASSNAIEVKEATAQALAKLGVDANSPADAAFLSLADRFYSGQSVVKPRPVGDRAFVWYWKEGTGLEKKDVPAGVFKDVMAMREAEYALQLAGDASNDVSDKALALWLDANYRRELGVTADNPDMTRPENTPTAHYYGVTAGPKYLGMALDRALKDGDAKLAYTVIKSFEQPAEMTPENAGQPTSNDVVAIIGPSNLDVNANGAALVSALKYPDRLVRFEAAMALAEARPAAAFDGSDQVVPMLAEASAQTGKTTVLIVASSTDKLNTLSAGMKEKEKEFDVIGATTAADADNAARTKPGVDVVVIDTTLPDAEVQNVLALVNSNLKLRGSARLLLTQSTASPYEQLKQSDKLVTTVVANDAAAVAAAVTDAKSKASALPIDSELATRYAKRAAFLMKGLGESGGIYGLSAAKDTLILGLDDKDRPDLVKLVGGALAQINDPDVQKALLQKASQADLDKAVRISLYHSVAENARLYGRKLEQADTDTLQKAVTDADLDIRTAAAEARGALDLPAAEAKQIILQQIRR